jgi:uncharacterized protein YfbU (UPF0304 family)
MSQSRKIIWRNQNMMINFLDNNAEAKSTNTILYIIFSHSYQSKKIDLLDLIYSNSLKSIRLIFSFYTIHIAKSMNKRKKSSIKKRLICIIDTCHQSEEYIVDNLHRNSTLMGKNIKYQSCSQT